MKFHGCFLPSCSAHLVTSLEATISCHAQAIQSSLMVTETPRGCQHFYCEAIVAKQQGNNSHKFLRALQDPLARSRMQPQNTWSSSSKQASTTKPLEEEYYSPFFLWLLETNRNHSLLCRARGHLLPAPHRTCVYFARISWGQMLGVRAEKGPPAEGVWWPKQKEIQQWEPGRTPLKEHIGHRLFQQGKDFLSSLSLLPL